MSATIHFRACGGLGNQLFQYAAARALSIRSGAGVAVDRSWYDAIAPGITPRAFELSRYPLPLRDSTSAERLRGRLVAPRAGRSLAPLVGMRAVVESADAPLPPPRVAGSAYLVGYWQDERCFADVGDTLRRELVPTAPPGTEDEAVLRAIEAGESVSVHVRRGDYVTDTAAAAHHGTCPSTYYARAMERIAARVANPAFFVFSDDPVWTADNIRAPGPLRHVRHNPPELAFQDLRLMAACRHHVIANSSFSWWGAWLAGARGGIVIAPSRWFAAGGGDRIVPGRWERLGP